MELQNSLSETSVKLQNIFVCFMFVDFSSCVVAFVFDISVIHWTTIRTAYIPILIYRSFYTDQIYNRTLTFLDRNNNRGVPM